jgi:small conductance mechanosensitive channel
MDIQNLYQSLISWVLGHGVKIIAILIVTSLISRFLKVFIKKIVTKQIRDSIPAEEERKRIETLVSVFEGTLKFVIWIVALLMILPEFGINPTPILASLGVVGLAIGMAAKGIVIDFISGIFIILENQYHLGDEVKIAGLEGKVKEITLRRTIIQDKDGIIHSIPNGKVVTVSKKIS